MSKKHPKQENIEIQADMKVLLEIEQLSEAHEVRGRLSLGSYVEEVLPNGCVLIQMPIHRGYHYTLPKGKPIQMYLLAKSRMFSLAVQFLERVKRGNLIFAKMLRIGDITAGQRRDCFRLQCALPVMVERVTDGNAEPPPPISCRMKNLSDGGVLFATNEEFNISEKINLAFDIGTEETIEAEILRFEQATTEAEGERATSYRYQVAVKFLHKCQKQKDRFYRYIVEQQREIIRKQAEENEQMYLTVQKPHVQRMLSP